MKKIITAIGNNILNQKLKAENNFEIIKDIQYKEGIIEFLEKENNIDFLIISELLPGNIELINLIEKIKIINSQIQIILFLENKNQELENYLYAKGVYSVFYHNQIEIKEIINFIKNNDENTNNEIKKELNELKQILLEKDLIKNNLINNKKENNLEHKEIICITGNSGVGKSIFTINLAKSLKDYKRKILIIDFDVLNNSLHTILGIKKYSEKIRNKIKNNNLLKEIKIEELIIKINSKIDLISGINLLFDSKYKISSEKVKNILLTLKEKYDEIIIDTSSECFFDYTKEIIKNSNFNIFITEANLSEIKKAKNLLNIYINKWGIPQKNFNILFNKYNENSIDISILKHIFSDFTILGKLSVNSQYNLFINKNNNEKLNNNLKKEYLEKNKKILKNNKLIFNNNSFKIFIKNRLNKKGEK